jgi:hypothetical protein
MRRLPKITPFQQRRGGIDSKASAFCQCGCRALQQEARPHAHTAGLLPAWKADASGLRGVVSATGSDSTPNRIGVPGGNLGGFRDFDFGQGASTLHRRSKTPGGNGSWTSEGLSLLFWFFCHSAVARDVNISRQLTTRPHPPQDHPMSGSGLPSFSNLLLAIKAPARAPRADQIAQVAVPTRNQPVSPSTATPKTYQRTW